MASSSSSSSSLVPPPLHQIIYDVFISFRGPDVRRGFLSHLVEAFKERGVDAYVDDRIDRGEEISLALPEAIEKSQVSLIIFSKNYASSKWCLEELAKIIECWEQNNQIVIPVFYHIEPSDVRHQSGDYRIPFAKHEKRYDITTVTKWKTASKQAANISGLNVSNFRNEVKFMEEIVKCVLKKLESLDNEVYERGSKKLVGIQERVTDLELLLSNGSKDVCIIGIWGMGGIGKTTIANALFSKLYPKYRGCCFKANVREELEQHKVTDLKMKLFSELLKVENIKITMILEESYHLIRRLRRKKALILLDDAIDLDDLKLLINEGKDFGSGTIIIVTSRDKQVLSHVADDQIYEVEALNEDEALQLFSLNAFKQEHPEKVWIELSSRVVQYAEGNPLALKILGPLLFNAEPEEWESLLERLKKISCIGIQKLLRFSYDRLERDHQKMFLYLACFFKSWSDEESIRILLDACGFSTLFGFKILQNKALITISKKCVKMHNLIREMAYEIVREKSFDELGKRSHLWDANDIHQVLMNNSGTKAIQSITLDTTKIKELHLHPRVFKKMANLKLLKFYGSKGQCRLHLPEGLESLPNQLRLFHWEGYPSKSLPLTFHGENLVELNMQWSRVEKLWDGVPDLPSLKSINLSYSRHLIRLPDFSKASNLEIIWLRECFSLVDIHESIFSLHRLDRLLIEGCININSLRSNVHLKSLRFLSLQHCSGLKEFSVTSGEIEFLILSYTAIDELPQSIKCLRKLRALALNNCENLKHLPNELSELRYLQDLCLSNCKNLDPSNLCILFDGLRSLESLYLEHCYNLSELPDNICNLSLLACLKLNGSNVKIIPPSFKYLSKLSLLNLSNNRRLQRITNLPSSIEYLYTYECKRLQSISAVLPSIKQLHADDCKRLKSIVLISTSIKELCVSNAGSLRTISILPPSTESIFQLLHDLSLSGSNARIMPSSFKHLSWLSIVSLRNCWWLECVSDLPPSIIKLDVSNCRRLRYLLGIPPSITLNAMNCRSLEVTGFSSPLFLRPKQFFGSPVLSFMNCINLDEHAVNSLMEFFHSIIKQISWLSEVDFCLPGWKVPDWFRHRTRGSSITIPLNLSPNSKFIGFICCIIVSEFQSNERYQLLGWECDCHLEARDDRILKNYDGTIGDHYVDNNHKKLAMKLISDHMILWYRFWNCHEKDIITHETNILLEFKVKTHHGKSDIVIKECGVHPLYASEYLNSAKRLELEEYLQRESESESESWEATNEIEVGISDGTKQQRGMLPPIHKTFLPNPTGISKEGPSGLKELLKF